MLPRLLLTIVLFAGLVSAQENSGDKRTKSELEHYSIDSTLIEMISDISKENDMFLDIPPLPIFEELTDLDNEHVDLVFESVSEFNELINNDQEKLVSVEQPVTSSKDYDTCKTIMNITECIFFRDKGEYSLTIKQNINPTSYNRYGMYISGVFDGVDYGSMYLLQDQYKDFEGKGFSWLFYQLPSPPECANQLRRTLEMLIIDDESTIYTPWGISSNREMVFMTTHYIWDYAVDYNHPMSLNKMSLKGSVLTLSISTWSYNKEALYPFWLATWDFESHSGTWMHIDENGIVQNTGPM
ncbi:MAG: hypothetical protein KJN64_11890 [Ignavibacteria bacterium]|nr:hypothetical protein [Ignavibacteria bacterium]MBT8383959.1 hypothetical protein [Ignavibacteria bacterium]MBT8391327.1 hypothetical protein [Ignavibacteria bacterium]NNL20564.1 hypothetical protein [Ignavibacteriaceae bacterium]